MYSNILYFAIKSFYFCYSFNFFIHFHYYIFEGKIALWLISYVAKMLVAKMFTAKMLMVEIPDMSCMVLGRLLHPSLLWFLHG